MRELTDQEMKLVSNGAAAEAFLENPAMASAINELSEVLGNLLLNSAPEENEKRERLYNVHLALKELIAILNHRVAIKANIEASLVDDPENE